ncbi:MAG: hypothetical protein J6Y69_10055 [Treponema sp.]|nr:hypothetical protein [Treponema sp.]
MIVEEKLHVLNKQGQVMDISLTDVKSEALGTDEGDGTCLSVFRNGRILYAATNDKVDVPDPALLALKDSQGQLRYVHGIPGTKTLVLDATYTGNFDIDLDCPYGGRIIIRSSNGSQGYNGKSNSWSSANGRYGGNSGYGWKLNLGNLSDYVEFTAPSGGGGGARGQNSNYSAGGGGAGSQLVLEFGRLSLPLSARTGLNGGGSGTFHSSPNNDDGGPGGASWPYSDSSTTHKGQASQNQGRTESCTKDKYGHTTCTVTNYGSRGGAGGAGYKNQAVREWYVNGLDKSSLVADLAEVTVNVSGFDISASLSDLSTTTHSVEIYKYMYV